MLPFAVHQHSHCELGHLAYLLFEGEGLQERIYPALHPLVSADCRGSDAPAVTGDVFELEVHYRIVV